MKFLEFVKKFVCVPKMLLGFAWVRKVNAYKGIIYCMWANKIEFGLCENKEKVDYAKEVWEFAVDSQIEGMVSFVDPFVKEWLGI